MEDLIWRRHVRSGIILTIIESAYPYILEQRKESICEKVLVDCPEFEEHELGARMVSDFFRLEGFDTTFAGDDFSLEGYKDIQQLRRGAKSDETWIRKQ